MRKNVFTLIFAMLLAIALSTPAFAAGTGKGKGRGRGKGRASPICQTCPHSCFSHNFPKPPCKDWKNAQGLCCADPMPTSAPVTSTEENENNVESELEPR